jgi:hypothetical protein
MPPMAGHIESAAVRTAGPVHPPLHPARCCSVTCSSRRLRARVQTFDDCHCVSFTYAVSSRRKGGVVFVMH